MCLTCLNSSPMHETQAIDTAFGWLFHSFLPDMTRHDSHAYTATFNVASRARNLGESIANTQQLSTA